MRRINNNNERVNNTVSNNSNSTAMRTINSNNNSERVNSVSNNSNVTTMVQVDNISFEEFMKKAKDIIEETFSDCLLFEASIVCRCLRFAEGMKNLCGSTEISTEEFSVTTKIRKNMSKDITPKDLKGFIWFSKLQDKDLDEVKVLFEKEIKDYDKEIKKTIIKFYELLGFEVVKSKMRYVADDAEKNEAVAVAADEAVEKIESDGYYTYNGYKIGLESVYYNENELIDAIRRTISRKLKIGKLSAKMDTVIIKSLVNHGWNCLKNRI